MALVAALLEILQRPTFVEVLSELVMFMAPIWIAVVVGVLVGWAWKPKWANLAPEYASAPSSLMLLQNLSSGFASISILNPIKFHSISGIKETPSQDSLSSSQSSSSQLEGDKTVVTDADLRYLDQLVEEQDGGHPWIQMMDRSTSNMSYQAWRRDPETGPPQYRSRTIYEDATPEMVRDFFWDDEFRLKWDDMHVHAETLEVCPTTGTMMVQWVRKFPFFCSDREYIIGRRIWKSGLVYYCVTKGLPCSSVPRRNKPRRVDLYYSSWCIRAAESKRDGRMTATEVLLFHYEDMGIPWEIAKLGVRQGMWGAVRKIDHGLRAYQKQRDSEVALSRSANLAQVNTKVDIDTFRSLGFRSPGSGTDVSEIETEDSPQKPVGRNIPRCLVVGGAIALACSIDRGLLTKAVIFGVARKFAGIGKRL